MNTAIDQIGNKDCTGCFGCYNICPKGAIEMRIDKEGFYKPWINSDLCDSCGVCQNVCPVMTVPLLVGVDSPQSFAAWSDDIEKRMMSSSGGVFQEIAKVIIDEGGIVFGVAWDDSFLPHHIQVDAVESLYCLAGSKYVQSKVGTTYNEVLNNALIGRKVLFSGLPCQTSALINYLTYNNAYIKNVYTVDLICHGVNSLIVYKSWLNYITKGKEINFITFRDKSSGWSNFNVMISYGKNEERKQYKKVFRRDVFYWGYLSNLYLANACYNCKFAKVPRTSDITLGDFWGVPAHLRDERGVSIVLINSKKGNELISQTNGLILNKVDISLAKKGNPRLCSGKYKQPRQREKIINTVQDQEFAKVKRLIEREKLKNEITRLLKMPLRILRTIPEIVR